MLSIIVAIAQNNAIGKAGQLLYHLPNDLKRFKSLTTGHAIIMGRKTFNGKPSIPSRTLLTTATHSPTPLSITYAANRPS